MSVFSLRSIFRFDQHQTTAFREVVAGLTTFTTMSYIVVVNPAMAVVSPSHPISAAS